jgi:hypothetical protein
MSYGDSRLIVSLLCGAVVQLVRTPACHVGGREFESRQPRQNMQGVTVQAVTPFVCQRTLSLLHFFHVFDGEVVLFRFPVDVAGIGNIHLKCDIFGLICANGFNFDCRRLPSFQVNYKGSLFLSHTIPASPWAYAPARLLQE